MLEQVGRKRERTLASSVDSTPPLKRKKGNTGNEIHILENKNVLSNSSLLLDVLGSVGDWGDESNELEYDIVSPDLDLCEYYYNDMDREYLVPPRDVVNRTNCYGREKRCSSNVLENKLEINEVFRNIDERDSFNEFEIRCLFSLQCYLPSVEYIKYDKMKNLLLCPCCSLNQCLSYCPLKKEMWNVLDTLQWMNEVNWKEKDFAITLVPDFAATNTKVISFLTIRKKIFPENYRKYVESGESIIPIAMEYSRTLWFFTKKINIEQIHKVRLQRAVCRLLKFEMDSFSQDDIYLLMKLTRLLLIIADNSSADINQIWPSISIDNPILKTPINITTKKLNDLATFIEEFFKDRNHFPPGNLNNVENNYRTTEWGVNINYIENGTSEPIIDKTTCTMYCSILSNMDLKSISLTILKKLSKRFNLTIRDNSEVSDYGGKSMVTCYSEDRVNNTFISCTADNWMGDSNIHLMIKVKHNTLLDVIENIKKDIKSTLKLKHNDDISVLLYDKQSYSFIDNSGIPITFTTGESYEQHRQQTITFPSTIVSVGLEDDVAQAVLTYSHNKETLQHGPTIQIISINKDCQFGRNKTIGRIVLAKIAFDFLHFWKQREPRYKLYASYVTSGHSFFQKMGFNFFDL